MLGPYVRQEMGGIEIALSEFEDGRRLSRLPHLLARPRIPRDATNGATEVAEFAGRLVGRGAK